MKKTAALLLMFACPGFLLPGCSGGGGGDDDPMVLQTEYDAATAITRTLSGVDWVQFLASESSPWAKMKAGVNHVGPTLPGSAGPGGEMSKVSAGRAASLPLRMESGPEAGACGGTRTIILDFSESGREFVEYAELAAYDDCETTLDGRTAYEFRDFEDGTGYAKSAFTRFTLSDSQTGARLYYIDGYSNLRWETSADDYVQTIETSITRIYDDNKLAFRDMTIGITFDGYVDTYEIVGGLLLDGRYAAVTTTLVLEGDEAVSYTPARSRLMFDGDGKVRATLLDEVMRVEIDADEDGTYEYDQTKSWADWQAIAAD